MDTFTEGQHVMIVDQNHPRFRRTGTVSRDIQSRIRNPAFDFKRISLNPLEGDPPGELFCFARNHQLISIRSVPEDPGEAPEPDEPEH